MTSKDEGLRKSLEDWQQRSACDHFEEQRRKYIPQPSLAQRDHRARVADKQAARAKCWVNSEIPVSQTGC